MGDCESCDQPAVVLVNGRGACAEHIDLLMGSVFGPVQQAIREVTDG